MPGKAPMAIRAFIESIPDAKLVGFADPNPTYTIYTNVDFRLDLQNKTSTKPPKYNLQVQVNRHSTISTLKNMKQKTGKTSTSVAKALVPTDGSWSAARVRAALLAGRMF
ncbi:uncharacterized protein B0H64DRAFT_205336 [Chaetomium fimeti]|uniref:Uncharacterized protein n=1 Tax=Chaetomium fimeti TaxID=1854472 RepID=A0AAE0HAW4_9PEZI|nr:hypothetical protein B0H64DRAFT_205336 [Chaetomium fimeti]